MGREKENQQEVEFLTELGQSYSEQQKAQLEQYSDKKAPKELDDWFQDFCNKAFSEEAATENMVAALPELKEKKRIRSNRVRMLKRVAAIVLIVCGIGIVGTTVSAEAFHFDLWKLFVGDRGDNIVVSSTDKLPEIDYFLSSDWYGFYCPTYLPEGYELISEEMKNRYGILKFCSDEKELTFYIFYDDAVVALDTENASYQKVRIDEKDLYYSISSENETATGYIDNYLLKIMYTNISEQEIDKIFKNFKIFRE